MRGYKARILYIFMAVVTAAAVCASCRPPKPKTAEVDEHAADDEYITCMVWDRDNLPEGKTFDDNKFAEWIRENVKKDCGVEVHFKSIPRNNSDETLQMMVEAGEEPDIFFTYAPSVFGYMTSQGRAADITNAVNTYGDNISKYIGDIQNLGKYGDLQVAVMKMRGFQMPRHVAYIRKDWCDALNMEVPSTKEELFNYLYAVKEQNPGNVDGVIPWGMGGSIDTEKFYQNFVVSYVSDISDEDAYVYAEKFMVLKDEATDGLRKMNELYNDGIISIDFALDLDNETFYSDLKSGKVGFFIDNNTGPFQFFKELKETNPAINYVPVMCFDLPGGGYRNVVEPKQGMYVMISAGSKNKINAAVKYLNWLADPQNAENIVFTPEHEYNEYGAPFIQADRDLLAEGYSGEPLDYCIVNEHFNYLDDRDALVSSWYEGGSWADREWYEKFYDVCVTDQYVFDKYHEILDAESKYQTWLETGLVEYAYNIISCPKGEVDSVISQEYDYLVENGLSDVLNERISDFKSGNVIKKE